MGVLCETDSDLVMMLECGDDGGCEMKRWSGVRDFRGGGV